jgi:hypothetical protein
MCRLLAAPVENGDARAGKDVGMLMVRSLQAAGLALALISGPSLAGPVILTVSGLDEARYPGGVQTFDLEMLRSLGQAEVTTTTIWTEGTRVFTGVPLIRLAETLQINEGHLRLLALNDYQIEFPLHEAGDEAPILAYWMDGAPMSVRDKGPLWVIYPYDSDATYRTDTIFSRSIWQLDRIEVLR